MRRLTLSGGLALAVVAAALAWPMQGPNGVQNAHYALVRALAAGTTSIDKARGEVGEASTNDVSHYRGHYYSNKAPGLALLCTPFFAVLKAVGADGDPTRTLWALGLVGSVLPAFVLALLVALAAGRVAPALAVAAGVATALGTLVFPYATIFLSHTLSAALVFGAFVLLWFAPARPLAAVGAGVLAGYAVTTEYPNAIALVFLAVYALTRANVRHALAFVGGGVVGIIPLLLYDWAAFGSPFRISYRVTDLPTPPQFTRPSLHVALSLVFGFPELLTLTPIVLLGGLGCILLWRRGLRHEAVLSIALALAYVTYNSAFYSPLGGYSPGPRYLVTVVPFLLFPLGAVAARLPFATAAVTATSVAVMTLLSATHALAGYDGRWLDRLEDRDVSLTAASLVGITGAVAIVPLLLAGPVAVWLAWRGTRVREALDPLLGGALVGLWALGAAFAPNAYSADAARLVNFVPPLLAFTAFGLLGAYALRRA